MTQTIVEKYAYKCSKARSPLNETGKLTNLNPEPGSNVAGTRVFGAKTVLVSLSTLNLKERVNYEIVIENKEGRKLFWKVYVAYICETRPSLLQVTPTHISHGFSSFQLLRTVPLGSSEDFIAIKAETGTLVGIYRQNKHEVGMLTNLQRRVL